MSYKLPPLQRLQASDSTTQVITDTTLAYPVLFDTNDDVAGITHDVTGATVTISQANPGVVTWTGNTLANGDCIKLTNVGGALPTGLTAGTAYFVVNLSGNTFNLAAKPGGTGIQTSSAGSGTHTAKCTHKFILNTTGDWLLVYSIIANGGLGDHIDIWARLDGSNIARSNTICEFARANAEQVISCSFILTTTSGTQKFELYWRGDNTNCQLLATGTQASPTRPACPSAILTINKISK